MNAMKVPKEFVFEGVELVSRVVPPGPTGRYEGADICTGCYFHENGIDCVDTPQLREEQIPDCTEFGPEFGPGWTGMLKNYIFIKKETA